MNVGHKKALLLIMENISTCLYAYANDIVESEKQRWNKQQFQEQKQTRRNEMQCTRGRPGLSWEKGVNQS